MAGLTPVAILDSTLEQTITIDPEQQGKYVIIKGDTWNDGVGIDDDPASVNDDDPYLHMQAVKVYGVLLP